MLHYVIIIGAWLVASLIIAGLGSKFRFGFWGYFFGSVLLSPLVGLLCLLAAVPVKAGRRES